jgi:hypothetical protein
MNTGRRETNYGYWYPGVENDGAAGWQYMPEKYGRAWMGDSEPRGAWRYDGEIDLGFIGALRMASTILTRDPVFDWVAYGGELSHKDTTISVIPRDGLRQRFVAVLPNEQLPFPHARKFKLELDRDGFAAGQPIVTDEKLGKLSFTLENRTADKHFTELLLSFPSGVSYDVAQSGQNVILERTGDWDYPWKAVVEMNQGSSTIEITRTR